MRTLALDLSTSTGWALFSDSTPESYGSHKIHIADFNVNDYPEREKVYPFNIVDAANEVSYFVIALVMEFEPDIIVIENTVRGRNRHTQRALEFIHKAVLDNLQFVKHKVKYTDVSKWRSLLKMYLTPEDKKHNKTKDSRTILNSLITARGKITKKHLAIRKVFELFGIELKMNQNDIADALLLGFAWQLDNSK